MLRIYAYPSHHWEFVRGGPLFIPSRAGSLIGSQEQAGTTYQIWAPWVRADLTRGPSAPPHAAEPAGIGLDGHAKGPPALRSKRTHSGSRAGTGQRSAAGAS